LYDLTRDSIEDRLRSRGVRFFDFLDYDRAELLKVEVDEVAYDTVMLVAQILKDSAHGILKRSVNARRVLETGKYQEITFAQESQSLYNQAV
jgi:hypothetical protein